MISVVIPLYNEEENIKPLVNELNDVIKDIDGKAEIVFVDDGSIDNTVSVLEKELRKYDLKFKIVKLRRNFGQTAAIMAGFDNAEGDIIITMDGDLQNDPKDIKKILQYMDEYDVVSGWRKNRKDPFFTRVLPSKIANFIISRYLGLYLHDYGCTLKGYKKDIVKNIRLYGEMHRFIPVFALIEGAKIKEIEVNHRPRKYGKTKYGLSRIFRVILDMITVKFLLSFFTSPMHFIGGWGIISSFIGILSFILTLIMKWYWKIDMTGNPLLYLSGTFIILGVQLILMGIIAEVEVRTYFEAQNRRPYSIKKIINQ